MSPNEFYQIGPVSVDAGATSTSWRVPKPVHPICTSTSYQDIVTSIVDQDAHVYNVSTRKQNPYVVTTNSNSNNNEAFIGDSCNNITSQHHHHVKISSTPPLSPKLGCSGGVVNKRVVETTTQFMQQSSTNGGGGGETINNDNYNYGSPSDNYQQMSTKQYKNIPITVTNSNSSGAAMMSSSGNANNVHISSNYPKYDSDV